MTDKARLRIQAMQQRLALTPALRKQYSAEIIAALIKHFAWSTIDCVHCYLPHHAKMEVDTQPFFDYLFAEQPHITVVTNRLNLATHQIDCCIVRADTPLVSNHFQIAEPDQNTIVIDPQKINVMILPLLACDLQGNRLGYGKGYYDRLLARCSADMLRVGINYFPPLKENIPHEAHDMPINALMTQGDYFNVSGSTFSAL